MELIRAAEVKSFSNSGVTSRSEQVWIALRGSGQLLVEGGAVPFAEGDAARFEDGDLHGFENTGGTEFEYLSVTSRPLNFRAAYERAWPGSPKPER